MTIALIGAGGKMGLRITRNLLGSEEKTHYVEVSPVGIARLEEIGVQVAPLESALSASDVAILAVPDTVLASVAEQVSRAMKPGTLALALDPAVPLAGGLIHRDDLSYGIAHPCHPSLFHWEPVEADLRDFYGGISASQGAVAALVQGPESVYAQVEALARRIFAPVDSVFRLTLPQMATLEPALVETLAQTCMEVIREGLDEVIARGVPADAARAFLLGHLRIQAAVLFKEVDGSFSDAAYKISRRARARIFRDDWKSIFTPEDIAEQVAIIVRKEEP